MLRWLLCRRGRHNPTRLTLVFQDGIVMCVVCVRCAGVLSDAVATGHEVIDLSEGAEE